MIREEWLVALMLWSGLALVLGACQIDSEVGSNAILLGDAAATSDAFQPFLCSDHIDNDGDGLIDYPFDPGCATAFAQSEEDPLVLPLCFNQIDDDGDSIVDFPIDPGCESASDGDENDLAIPPACADQVDNDGNELVDYPEDFGCYAAGDPDESSVTS